MKYDTNKNPVELAGSKIENSSEGNDIDVAKNISEFENNYTNTFDSYSKEEDETSNSYNSENLLRKLLLITLDIVLVAIVISFIVRQVEIKAEHMTMQGMIINLFLS